MPFDDTFANEQKIRINLSYKALNIIKEDMEIFKLKSMGTIINIIWENSRETSKSSIIKHMKMKEIYLNEILNIKDEKTKKYNVETLLFEEKQEIESIIKIFLDKKGITKIFHINDNNTNYLVEECVEDKFELYGKKHPSKYLKCLLEEYSELPFIERERVIQLHIYEEIEDAIMHKNVVKISALFQGKETLFYAKPYKIMSDAMGTQSYLVCKSRLFRNTEEMLQIASFNMYRIKKAKRVKSEHFSFKEKEINNIEENISKKTVAYLLGDAEIIKVKLSETGKTMYNNILFSRPIYESISPEGYYCFNCSTLQIKNYFFKFGKEVEIIYPLELRNMFKNEYSLALSLYNE
jgi:hypothetical protein